MTGQRSRFGFRAVTPADLPMLSRWLAEPHVSQWWDDAPGATTEIEQAMEDVSTEPLIVELDGKPFAYIQSYDPHLEDGHPYQDQPMGTLGIDQFIGVPALVGKGHGSAMIDAFVAILFAEGAPRVILDPDPTNAAAIRAYEKAGFTAFDTRTTQYGPALMMARDNPEETDS